MYTNGLWYNCFNTANIVHILTTGDSSKMENHRPISLLQTVYEVIATMMKNRLVTPLEDWITITQYGFRPNRSTSQAVFIARCLLDIAERAGTNMTLILLDWEKVFDTIDQSILLQVLRRLRVRRRMMTCINNLDSDPHFKVSFCHHESTEKSQSSGIRQGCPLSLFLFALVMA